MPIRMEKFFNSIPEEHKKEVSKRLWLANEIMMKTMVGKIEVLGKENMEKLPPDAKIVVMTTHFTDLDVPVAIHTVANDLNVAIVDMSVHHKPFGEQGEFGSYLAGKFAGMNNFIPIGFKKDKDGGKSSKAFDSNDFIPAIKAINEEGRAVMIAAHNPTESKSLDEVKGGYGGVYLAEMTDAYILPITITFDNSTYKYGDRINVATKEKPNAHVVIGEPFKLEKTNGIERFSQITEKRENGDKLSDEEIQEFSKLSHALREQSQIVIKKMSIQIDTPS